MKIKHQLNLFILLVILIPIIALTTIPVNQHIATGYSISSEKLTLFTLLLTGSLELACILFTLHISRTITRSINFLQNSTKRLANKEIRHSIERRKSNRGENEITDLILNLEKMRLALKEDDERRKRFIMGMSHDLRTPIAVIKGYLEAVEDGIVKNPDDVAKSIKILISKTKQLETMINSLINFVKLETNDWKDKLTVQPILPLLKEFEESCINSGKIFNRNVKTEINISENSNVLYNKELVIRALENLYSNAQRYTKENGNITIKAVEDENFITLSIEDSGIGIEDKDIQFIFDIFYRASNSREEEGHGIGLSVVKNILETHNWKIDVKSQIGIGTVFTILIPKICSKA
ncbi:sensor histidine kinase [Treponema pectinovorum]|uniref:sensor histidine kinase n=1 Tax=Treponema pectinovorum TaxID=164 RepID=UPI0011C952B3|nr:HAMP domain-containing sensor histidine kinase [Treponema pectinovorum]